MTATCVMCDRQWIPGPLDNVKVCPACPGHSDPCWCNGCVGEGMCDDASPEVRAAAWDWTPKAVA